MEENTQNPQVQEAQPQENAQSQATPPNPYDTSLEESELQGLMGELENQKGSYKQDFANYLSENLSPDEKELFFDDEQKFFQLVLDKQEAFFNERVGSKEARARELESSINNKKAFETLERAEAEFVKKHPNADVDSMMEFYEEELGNRAKKQLDSLNPSEFFEKLFEIYSANTKQEPKQESKPPKRLEAQSVDASEAEMQNDDNYFDRL